MQRLNVVEASQAEIDSTQCGSRG